MRVDMRLSSVALLLLWLLLPSTLLAGRVSTSGQSTQIGDATSKLNAAFADVQNANSEGVSAAKISELSDELNTALSYRETAVLLNENGNLTGSDYYSSLSGNLSSRVSAEARELEANANSQLLLGRLLAALVVELAAIFSALLLVEFHRIKGFVRKRRMQRMGFR